MKVLIGDNNAASRAQLRRYVEEWGYEVTIAEGGAGAREILAQPEGPSMALLDWVMPHMTGPEVCRKVREMGRKPYIYLLLMAHQNDAAETLKGLAAGADDYIVKPFEPQELAVRLRAGRRIIELQKESLRAGG